MDLDSITAQHIIEQIPSCLGIDIWFLDSSSQMLASTQPNYPHPPSILLNATEGASRNDYVSVPLHYANKAIGTLIITGIDQQRQEVVQVVKVLAELIIYQAVVFEQLVDRQLALNKFIYQLFHGQVDDNPILVLQEANLLQIDFLQHDS